MLFCGTTVASLTLQSPAVAQSERVGNTEEVVVTGSRLVQNGYNSPVPVTVVDADLIERMGQVNAQDVVRLVPQNIAGQSDATSGTALSANAGSSFANLRGLNPGNGTRTLTLVNGRRFVPSSDGGQVDLNLIPSVMIQRVETMAGGASAAYGSDAVAGVVNVILDDNLEGFKAQVSNGETFEHDGQSVHAAMAYGLDVAGGRGHLIIGGEYQRNEGIERCYFARDWCAEGWAIFANEASVQPGTPNTPENVSGFNVPGSYGYGLPNYVLARNAGLFYNSPYGTIRNFYRGPGTSTTAYNANFPAIEPPYEMTDKVFTPDGRAVIDYDPGVFGPKLVGDIASGGDNISHYADQYIQTPIERYTTYGSFNFGLTDRLAFYSELTYAERDANARSLAAATRSTMPIKADNAFLPPDVAAALNGAAFSFGKDMDLELDNRIQADAKVFRGVVGLRGDLLNDWTWDLYYQYGDNQRDSSVRYSRHNDAFFMAIDAIVDPSDPSRVICRPLDETAMARLSPEYQQQLIALHANCKPLNLFGIGNMDPEAVAFAWHQVEEDFKFTQKVLAASVQGTLAEGWAGPIGMAGGIELRDESGDVTHGGLVASDYAFSFGLDYAGKIEVVEGFVETAIPLFRDAALGEYFELNGAVRYTGTKSTDTLLNASRSVDATSWKLSAIYDIAAGVRLRATRSRDIRAAGFRELFQKTAPTEEGTAQGRVNNPNIPGANQADATPIYTGGNFTLSPEIGDTTTFGVVYTPRAIGGFQISVDWYQIELTDAITNLAAQRVTDLCVLYDTLCNRITFASPTDIIRVDAGQANVGTMDISGVDLEASYVKAVGAGDLFMRLLLSRQNEYLVQENPLVPAIDYAGQTGSVVAGGFYPSPEWMGTLLVGYNTDRFNVTMTFRHIGDGILNKQRIGPEDEGYSPTLRDSISTNRVAGANYVNLAASYAFPLSGGQELEVFGLVDNLLDKAPPVAPAGGYPTNPVLFDTFGRRYRAGVRIRF
jgi:iron complex outermembrane receptor protein